MAVASAVADRDRRYAIAPDGQRYLTTLPQFVPFRPDQGGMVARGQGGAKYTETAMTGLPRNVQGGRFSGHVRSRRNLTHAGAYRVHASRVPGLPRN